MKWTVLVDNRTNNPTIETEHGLSILLETEKLSILLDTGASDMLMRNAEQLGKDLSRSLQRPSAGDSFPSAVICIALLRSGRRSVMTGNSGRNKRIGAKTESIVSSYAILHQSLHRRRRLCHPARRDG